MAFAYCPDCAARLYLGRSPWLGQPVTCDHCDAELEIINLRPPELDWTDELLDTDWRPEVEIAESVPV